MAYDADGNVTDDGTNQYLYDAENRLCATQSDFTHAMTGYLYDGMGNRLAKGTLTSFSCDFTTNGFAETSVYVPGLQGEQLQEDDSSGNLRHLNVFLGGRVLATCAGAGYQQANWHYSLNDWTGTRRVQANAEGVSEGTFQTIPFGDGLTVTGTFGATENEFTGKERDAESGNDYFPARYYSNNTGRFLTPDWSATPQPVPYADLRNPQSLNLFSFVTNNPLSMVDVSGHQGTQQQNEIPSCSSLYASGTYINCEEGLGSLIAKFDEFDVLQSGLTPTGTEWISAIDDSNPISDGGADVFQTEELGLPVYGNADLLSLLGAGVQMSGGNLGHFTNSGPTASHCAGAALKKNAVALGP